MSHWQVLGRNEFKDQPMNIVALTHRRVLRDASGRRHQQPLGDCHRRKCGRELGSSPPSLPAACADFQTVDVI